MHNLVHIGQNTATYMAQSLYVCIQTRPQKPHISFISLYLYHCYHHNACILTKGKNAKIRGPKPLCVFRWALNSSHLIVSLYLEETVCLMNLKTMDIIILLPKFYWHIISVLRFAEKCILLPKFCVVINSLPFR